jgi:hypothetical protein
MKSRSLMLPLIATALALLFGLALHFLAVFLRDNGPSFDGISLLAHFRPVPIHRVLELPLQAGLDAQGRAFLIPFVIVTTILTT